MKKKQVYELSNLALLYYKITLETLHTGLFYVIFHTSAQPHEIGGSSFCCSCNGRRWEEERLEHNGMKSFQREHFYSYQPAFLEGVNSIFISWPFEITQKLSLMCKVRFHWSWKFNRSPQIYQLLWHATLRPTCVFCYLLIKFVYVIFQTWARWEKSSTSNST